MRSHFFVRRLALVCALLLWTFFLSSCGGGGGGGSSTPAPVAALAGTWAGSLEDDVGTMHTLSVTIGGPGDITQILIDGQNQGLTGTIAVAETNIFSFTLSDGTVGGFIADASATHAGFLDESFAFEVVQKGAAGLPGYAITDIAGNWTGYGVVLNADLTLAQTFASSAVINNDGNRTFSGTGVAGGFTGSFPSATLGFGRWEGNYADNDDATDSGPVNAFLSPDKTFAASWACDGPIDFPTGCTFSVWSR